jgi:hypothetical protein
MAACSAAACATKYQEMGWTGGVSAQPITNDTYRVKAGGNAYTASSTVQDYVLLKAAETTVAAGKTHFVIINAEDTSKREIDQDAGVMNTTVHGSVTLTTYTPGSTSVTVKPGKDVYIRVFTPKPNEPAIPNGIRAEEIIANIGPRVRRPD